MEYYDKNNNKTNFCAFYKKEFWEIVYCQLHYFWIMEVVFWITASRDFSHVCQSSKYWEPAQLLCTATWLSDTNTNTNQFLSLTLQFPNKNTASIIWHAESSG